MHCKIGYSRSAAVVGTYLRAAGLAGSTDEAIALMRRARPTLIVRHEARRAMQSGPDLSAGEEMSEQGTWSHQVSFPCFEETKG